MKTWRMPLSLGAGALSLTAWGVSLALGGTLWVGAALAMFITGQGSLGYAALGVLGALAVPTGVSTLRSAHSARPTDAVLDTHGVLIDGGAHHGLRLAWADLDAEKTKAHDQPGSLTLVTRSEGAGQAGLVLASAETEEEILSLAALRTTILARLSGLEPKVVPRTSVLACGGCGAALTPADEPQLSCSHCGSTTPTPDALRNQVVHARQEAADRQSAGSVVASLLVQRGAHQANVVVVVASVSLAIAWGATLAPLGLVGASFVDPVMLILLTGTGTFATFSVLTFGRRLISDRRALRLLATEFAARAGPGDAPCCRHCLGPLPWVSSAANPVVRCVYCRSENVLGLDVAPAAAEAATHREEVEGLLRERKQERWRFALRGAVAAVLALVSGVLGLGALSSALQFRDELARCDAKVPDAEACESVALSLSTGAALAKDEARSYRYALKACGLGRGVACRDAGLRLRYGWAVERDEARGRKLLTQACEDGLSAACKDLLDE